MVLTTEGFLYIYIYIYIYMVLTTEGFLESWPEWDLNPRPLNSVSGLGVLYLTVTGFIISSVC